MTTTTQLSQHRWVRYSLELVDVIADPESGETCSAAAGKPIGEQVACSVCNEPLTFGLVGTLCLGDSPSP